MEYIRNVTLTPYLTYTSHILISTESFQMLKFILITFLMFLYNRSVVKITKYFERIKI